MSNPKIPNKFRKVTAYRSLAWNSTLALSNLGQSDIEYLFTKDDSFLNFDKHLKFCENKLVDMIGNELFQGLESESDTDASSEEDDDSKCGKLNLDFGEILDEIDPGKGLISEPTIKIIRDLN